MGDIGPIDSAEMQWAPLSVHQNAVYNTPISPEAEKNKKILWLSCDFELWMSTKLKRAILYFYCTTGLSVS